MNIRVTNRRSTAVKTLLTVVLATTISLMTVVNTAQATYQGCPGHWLCGPPGPQGPQGEPGKDVDPLALAYSEDEMYGKMVDQNSLNLAIDSIEIFLPQEGKHRITLNRSLQTGGDAGNGIGYAYRFDGNSRTAIFAGWGESEGQHAGKFGISFEF